jgi:preprotein translocase subunit SecY
VGRRTYGGLSTHLPLRLNTGGVIPVIFASSILSIFQTIGQIPLAQRTVWARDLLHQFDYTMPLHNLLYFLFIIFFCYFYVSIIFNPMDTADNLQKFGGFIPGIRPGRRTAEYIDNILTRLTFVGSIPGIGSALEGILPGFLTQGLGVKFFFGGTSLLIVVGVAMDTVQQVESQLIMRHYEGFLKGARVKGRRG